MKKLFDLIKKYPKDFIEVLTGHNKTSYLCNSHWKDFDGENYLMFCEKSEDGSIAGDEIWFSFEEDAEGSTNMILGTHLKKPDGLLIFKNYVIPYKLEYDWDD